MRPLLLALVGLALFAPAAPAAVLSIEESFCGCDPSSGDEDTRTLVVAALPGEPNAITVERRRLGVLVQDSGAPLTGACRPANSGGGRFCRGRFDGVDMTLETVMTRCGTTVTSSTAGPAPTACERARSTARC